MNQQTLIDTWNTVVPQIHLEHERAKATELLEPVVIDFDAASRAWRHNKIIKHDCTYAYHCQHILLTGKRRGGLCNLAVSNSFTHCAKHQH